MKQVKIIQDKENLDGFALIGHHSYEIYINIEKLWKIAKEGYDKRVCKFPENRFIKAFAGTHTHEMIHILIKQCMPSLMIDTEYEYGEERIIYKMLNDLWTKDVEKFYKNDRVKK